MTGFGKAQEVTDAPKRKLYTGAENFKVVGLNPTKEELEKIYGREVKYTPEYLSKTDVTDSEGTREVDQIRLDFYLSNEDDSIKTILQFYIANTYHKSQSGKFKVINSFGKSTWLDEDSIKNMQAPDNMSWYNMTGVKAAKRGEVELIGFIVNILNLPINAEKSDDPSAGFARIDAKDWANIFKEDLSCLKAALNQTNNKIGILLGVKTKGDGSLVQTTMNKHTMRQYTIGSTKPTKFKYVLKTLHESQAQGAYGNVDFGVDDLVLREHVVNPTVMSSTNTDQLDVFDAGAPTESAGEEDWME